MEANIPDLRAIGGKLAAAGPNVGDAYQNRSAVLVPGGNAPSSGWSSASAISKSASRWGSFTAVLETDVTGHGNGLVAAADAMERADGDAAADVAAAGNGR